MKLRYTLENSKPVTIYNLPEAWMSKDYEALLALLDYEEDTSGMDATDLKELCCMALTDFEPERAAAKVLTYVLGNQLNPGQIKNLANEMREEKLWEEYADLSLHETFFNAHQLIYDAFKTGFPKPHALSFRVRVSASQARDLQYLKTQTEASFIRLLVQGMPENTRISRLYEEPLKGGLFDDAADIIWQLRLSEELANTLIADAISSHYWFDDLRLTSRFEAELHWDPE